MATAKRCDACKSYFTPRLYGIFKVGPPWGSLSYTSTVEAGFYFNTRDSVGPPLFSCQIDLCDQCTRFALRRVLGLLEEEAEHAG